MGLRVRPLTENREGGGQNWPTREKEGFGAKNNKETYFFKRSIFSSHTGRKRGVFRSCQYQKLGASGWHIPILSQYGSTSPGHSSGYFEQAYIVSVLFRVSAFTGAKLASGVPAVIGRFGP